MNEPDVLGDFLEHPPQPVQPTSLRDEVLARTMPVLRRRRIVRRSLVGAVAASIALIALWTWNRPTPLDPVEKSAPLAKQEPRPPVPETPVEPTPEPPMPLAVALEWKAFDAAEKDRAKLYVLAGNRYLDVHQDMTSALRCYQQALDAADASMRLVQSDDTWLLTALKLDLR
jgi:hypothetical protein